VAEVREFRLLKGLEPHRPCDSLHIQLIPSPYGSSSGFEVSAALLSDCGAERETHFQCVLGLQMMLPPAAARSRATHTDRTLSISTAYGQWLTRDARLQVIQSVEGLSSAGGSALVRLTSPAEWLPSGSPVERPWLFDPGLLDAAAQFISLWTKSYLGESVMPASYGRITRHRERLPNPLRMEFVRTESAAPNSVRGDVVFLDDRDDTVLSIEDLDCTLPGSVADRAKPAGVRESALT